jgi:hypothetical protein
VLALAELEALAARYRRERARRLSAPRAAAVRDQLAKAWRALRLAADAVGELDRYACAAAGMELVDLHGVHDLIEDMATKFGGAAKHVEGLGLNGRRRWSDYLAPPPKFNLVRTIADRLDELGIPLGDQVGGAFWDTAHEALYLAEEESSHGLSKVVADVISARKNRQIEERVHFLAIAAK